LKARPAWRIIRGVSEEPTRNLPQDGLERILARLDSMDSRLDSIDSRLGNVENRLSKVESRLTALEDKVDRRLQETRPIWEQVLTRLDSLESEMRTGFRRFGRRVGQLAKDVVEVRADQTDLDRRIDGLETKATQ
jgi:chromosome segregation ATPase